jgi:hypothetical protein
MNKFLNSDWLRAVQFFPEIQCQKMKYSVKKMKHSANFIDYLGFLIGLKYETITKIANKIQQFPAGNKHLANIFFKHLTNIFFYTKNKHLGVFSGDCIIFSCILLISNNSMVSRAI